MTWPTLTKWRLDRVQKLLSKLYWTAPQIRLNNKTQETTLNLILDAQRLIAEVQYHVHKTRVEQP